MRLRTPDVDRWATLRDHLVERLPRVAPERIDAMLAAGRFVGTAGPFSPDTSYRPGTHVWFHRDLPVEPRVPFEIGIVHRDEHLLVVDKPHFLATIPRGRHIVETALVRLRHELDLPELSPAHRLDRVTAGLLMFAVRRADRGAYQTLFRDRRVHKTYEALAPHRPDLELPRTVVSRIVKQRGIVRAFEVPGPPNAETRVELAEVRGEVGRYRLLPATGRTHQLRLHMAGLGVPILGDDFYPVLSERALDDYRDPLQLLASEMAFTDPVTGAHRHFTTRLHLRRWLAPSPGGSGVAFMPSGDGKATPLPPPMAPGMVGERPAIGT